MGLEDYWDLFAGGMTLVTSSYTYTTSQAWQSTTPVATDPSERVHVELNNWVNGISGSPLSILRKPSDATTKGSTSQVRWLITDNNNQNEFFSDFASKIGFEFMLRDGNAGATTSQMAAFTNWSQVGTANNGYGYFDYQYVKTSSWTVLNMAATSPVINTVYEADVAEPWFVCWQAQSSGYFYGLFKLGHTTMTGNSRSSGNPRSDWAMIYGTGTDICPIPCVYRDPNVNASTAAAHQALAFNYGNSKTARIFVNFPVSNNVFMGPCPAKTHAGWVGMPNKNAFVVATTATGALGDTCSIGGRTYTKTTSRLWVRTA